MHLNTARPCLRWLTAPCLLAAALNGAATVQAADLTKLPFEPNPGHLDAWLYVPAKLQQPAALVVALHGCTQQSHQFDDETGWTALAEEAGFLVLLPEQRPDNNPSRCFNWFNPRDQRRNGGEPESIRHLVEAVKTAYPVDGARVFVTGLSAGGGMTGVLLATHPDLFAGGAVLSGVPYGCATNAFTALPCMKFGNRLVPSPEAWAQLVRQAAPRDTTRWPRVAIWHDAEDTVVNPFNAASSLAQWTAVQGIDQIPDRGERVGIHERRVYQDAQGRPLVEAWITHGVGHATPIDPRNGCGHDDPEDQSDFVTDANLCAVRRIARFWGLVD